MPVKRQWYAVECLKNKRYNAGVAQYLVKFEGYPKDYWIPFYDIETILIQEYETSARNAAQSLRNSRQMKRSLNEGNASIPKKNHRKINGKS